MILRLNYVSVLNCDLQYLEKGKETSSNRSINWNLQSEAEVIKMYARSILTY